MLAGNKKLNPNKLVSSSFFIVNSLILIPIVLYPIFNIFLASQSRGYIIFDHFLNFMTIRYIIQIFIFHICINKIEHFIHFTSV
ncbi:hypothetical protein ASE55_03705 [Chryseobacterium sp. Leaf201]|nr:hypothetical protein ASE55_03705 [Chryseobacterium sp. Leaf201]